VLGAVLKAGEALSYVVGSGRHAYLVPTLGQISVDGMVANARDGVALDGGIMTIRAETDSELVLVDAV
jgi:quercetin 2,3-dioxygenase